MQLYYDSWKNHTVFPIVWGSIILLGLAWLSENRKQNYVVSSESYISHKAMQVGYELLLKTTLELKNKTKVSLW